MKTSSVGGFRLVVAVAAFIAVSVGYLSFTNDGSVNCHFLCPKKSTKKYHSECLEYALPPFPICWFHSVDYFVDKSIDGASRCCGDDTTQCRCPKKDTPEFQNRIEDWCTGIRKYCVPCDDDDVDDEGNCRGDGEQQQQAVVTVDATIMNNKESSPLMNDLLSREEEETVIIDSLPDDHIPLHHRSLTGGYGYHDDERCPTDDTYETKCLDSAIPPYPICTKKNVDEWVEHALKGYDHCCGGGHITALCKCPKRNTQQFASKIGDWCAGVEECSSPGGFTTTTTSTIMQQQQQQEEELTTQLRTSKERLEVPDAGGDEEGKN